MADPVCGLGVTTGVVAEVAGASSGVAVAGVAGASSGVAVAGSYHATSAHNSKN